MPRQFMREAKRHERASQANTAKLSVIKAPRYRRNDNLDWYKSFQGERDAYVETGTASQEAGDHARSARISTLVQAAV